jgi:hypothetical protein
MTDFGALTGSKQRSSLKYREKLLAPIAPLLISYFMLRRCVLRYAYFIHFKISGSVGRLPYMRIPMR